MPSTTGPCWEASARAAVISRNRAMSERIKAMAPESISEAIRLYMGGATFDDLRTANKKIQALVNSDNWRTAKTAYNAAKLIGGDAEEAAQYALLNGGADDNYIEWVLKYEHAKRPEDKERAATILAAMQRGDAAEVNDYIQGGGDVNLLSRTLKDFVGTKRQDQFGIELSDRIKYDKMSKAIQRLRSANKLTDSQTDQMRSQLMALVDEEGAIDTAGIQRALTKFQTGKDDKGNAVYTKIGASEDAVKEIMAAAGLSSRMGIEEMLSDKFDILDNWAKALQSLVDKISTNGSLAPNGEGDK